LDVPNAYEYVTYYTLSVQTSYITSVECVQSSNYCIQSGFTELDSASSNSSVANLNTQSKNSVESFENMESNLQNDVDKDAQDKLNAVLFMTANYYKKNATVEKSETKLGDVTEVKQAQSILTTRRCESAYVNFMNDSNTIKTKYASKTSNTDNISRNEWATQVKQYYDAREMIVNKTTAYASIRDAFLFGSGISLCDGSSNFDQSLLVSKYYLSF